MPNRKQMGFLVVVILGAVAFVHVGISYGWWQAGITLLAISIAITIIPIILGFLGFEELTDPGKWFDTADQLGNQKQRVIDHYSRLQIVDSMEH